MKVIGLLPCSLIFVQLRFRSERRKKVYPKGDVKFMISRSSLTTQKIFHSFLRFILLCLLRYSFPTLFACKHFNERLCISNTGVIALLNSLDG